MKGFFFFLFKGKEKVFFERVIRFYKDLKQEFLQCCCFVLIFEQCDVQGRNRLGVQQSTFWKINYIVGLRVDKYISTLSSVEFLSCKGFQLERGFWFRVGRVERKFQVQFNFRFMCFVSWGYLVEIFYSFILDFKFLRFVLNMFFCEGFIIFICLNQIFMCCFLIVFFFTLINDLQSFVYLF